MYSAIVFDVNETLLDLTAFDPAFANHFGTGNFRKQWFSEVLRLAFVSTIVGNYSDFGIIGHAALIRPPFLGNCHDDARVQRLPCGKTA